MKRLLIAVLVMLAAIPVMATVYVQDFEASTFPPVGWSMSSGRLIYRSTACSGYGSGTASLNMDFTINQAGVTQDILTLTTRAATASDSLAFDHAYATYDKEVDVLDIYTSNNGGGTWTLLVNLKGGVNGPLNTGGAMTQKFIPTADQWAHKKYTLPAGTNKIKFTATSAYGNMLYLDNIKVSYPTPAHDVGLTTMINPVSGTQIAGGTSLTPQATVKNTGGNAESFMVSFAAYFGTSQVYSQNVSVTNLAVNGTQDVSFPNWTPTVGDPFTFKCFTTLAGDAMVSNDTCKGTVNSYSCFRKVMAHDYTAYWCGQCPWQQDALKKLKDEVKDSICIVAFHPSTTNDSFYTQHSRDWMNYDGNIIGFPTTVWNGVDRIEGGWSTVYNDARALFDKNKTSKAPFSVTITGTRTSDGSSGNIRATINYPGSAPMAITAKITMVIIEQSKYCVWPGPTNWPKCDSMRDFVRDMFPSSLGDNITISGGKSAVIKDIPFTNAAGWNKPRLDYVVMVYDSASKVIYNASEINYTQLGYPGAVELSEFTAAAGNGVVTLSWMTASETDNYQWLIERSTHSDNGFTTIAVIDASNSPNGKTYSFSDNTAVPLTDYYYRLGDKDINGNVTWNGPVLVTSRGEMITEVSLAPCSPNPSRGQAIIRYALPKPDQVSLKLYDITGRLIKTLVSKHQNGGSYAAPWNGKDENGREVSSGIYLYQLKIGDFQSTQKLTLLR